MNKLLIALLVIILAGAILYAFLDQAPAQESATPAEQAQVAAPSNDVPVLTPQSVEDYVRKNISVLSSEKEVLGGTFYVTSIQAGNGAGTVSYEDGHNAYTADFKYEADTTGAVRVTSFTVRP